MTKASPSRSILTLAVLTVAALLVTESTGLAQFGRRPNRRAVTPQEFFPPPVVAPSFVGSDLLQAGSADNGLIAPRPRSSGHRHRYRGDNTDTYFGPIGPAGLNVSNGGATGFTVDAAHDGYYVPGQGVNNGFAAPEFAHGGYYVPGYGVNNGAARFERAAGGNYLPGFGVMGGVNAPLGPLSVPAAGGTYVPGFGVTGGLLGGPASFGQAATGGTHVPGLGVVGGRR